MKYIHIKTGEKAMLVYTDNIGNEFDIKTRYVMIGLDGRRFFVEGEELAQWKKL